MSIRLCKKCGFLLGTRPGMKDKEGVCLSCLNHEKKKQIDFAERQRWLTSYFDNQSSQGGEYDCVVGVSGGKDSTAIVKRLIENHGVKRPLLVHVCDEFTQSNAGKYNIDNLVKVFGVDIINFRFSPRKFVSETRKSFFEELFPLKWFEQQLYSIPIKIARTMDIHTVVMGENAAFEYGEVEECDIFHPMSDNKTKMIYMGAIYPYSALDSLQEAKKIGFKTLDDFDDWKRQGAGDSYSQIDSYGYMIHIWTKFIKFGFQRVSDVTSRLVRNGVISREEALQRIKDEDWVCDPLARIDFCRVLGISEEEFWTTIDKFANKELIKQDMCGNWKRIDNI